MKQELVNAIKAVCEDCTEKDCDGCKVRELLDQVEDERYTLGILKFVWNRKKAADNPENHDGITFEEAASAFFDQKAVTYPDEEHSESEEDDDVEGRYILVGMSQQANLLLVAHCYREDGGVIRIITAYEAGPKERERYDERKR